MLRCEHCGQLHPEQQTLCPITGKIFDPARLFPIGSLLEAKYRLDAVIGSGGMGAVFRATHTMLDKQVAVKLMLPDMARSQEMMARMVREARAASATGNQHVAGVTDMGWTEDGGLFIVMEYLRGETLQQIVGREHRLPLARAARLVCQLLSGLAAVHTRGIIHRDLKPENVMVVRDEEGEDLVKILDFGISKVLGDDGAVDLTRTGLVMGSPRYMAPEQARGAPEIDHRADLYAAGAILYVLLTGKPALDAPNLQAMLVQILQGEIVRPSRLVPELPAELDAIVLRAMAREQSQRYANATAFKDALRPFVGGDTIRLTSATKVAPPGAQGLSTSASRGALSALAGLSAEALVSLDEIGGEPGDAEPRLPVNVGSVVPPVSAPRAVAVGPIAARRPAAAADPYRPRPEEDAPIELDVDAQWRLEAEAREAAAASRRAVAAAAAEAEAEIDSARSRSTVSSGRSWLWTAVGALVGLMALSGGWMALERCDRSDVAAAVAEQKVYVLIETVPRDAEVFVDGVLQVTRPVELPQSAQLFSVRVQAAGYRSKTLSVRPDRNKSIRVELRRQRSAGGE